MCGLGVANKTQSVSQSPLKVNNCQWEHNVTCTAGTVLLQGGQSRTELGLGKHNTVLLVVAHRYVGCPWHGTQYPEMGREFKTSLQGPGNGI